MVFENKFPSCVPDAPKPEEAGTALTWTQPDVGADRLNLVSTDVYASAVPGLRQLLLQEVLHLHFVLTVEHPADSTRSEGDKVRVSFDLGRGSTYFPAFNG